MGRFKQAIDDLEIKELHLNGRAFTWSNEHELAMLECLDRVFISRDWEELFPDCFLEAQATTLSDHCPLVLSTALSCKAKQRFHFENF